MQVHIRKAQAGHASNGYTWPTDGAVIPVDIEHSAELLAIRDAGFEQVDPPDDASDDASDDDMDEVDRSPDTATDRPVKRGPGRPRKNP
ncbi:MAG: hypothetical protein NVS3B12_27650 [Acidimicrobiales bacterium]